MYSDQENLAPVFSDDEQDDIILKKDSSATIPGSAPSPNDALPQNQGLITFDQLQSILAIVKQSPEGSGSSNPFYEAADMVAKLAHHQSAQLPGILQTYAGKAGSLADIFMDLAKLTLLTQKYPGRSDSIKTYCIEFLRDLGSWEKSDLEKSSLAIRIAILSAKAGHDASALAARKQRNGKSQSFKKQHPYDHRGNQNQKQDKIRPPLI